MPAALKNLSFRRGDTPLLGLVLHGRNSETGEIVRLPRPTDVVSWTISWPSGAQTKTTAPSGGLTVDQSNGAILWPIQQSDVDGLAGPAPYQVKLLSGGSFTTTYLTGTISAEP